MGGDSKEMPMVIKRKMSYLRLRIRRAKYLYSRNLEVVATKHANTRHTCTYGRGGAHKDTKRKDGASIKARHGE